MIIERVRFTLDIDSGNQALVDNPREEVAASLRTVANLIEQGRDSGYCRDSNGNRVGHYYLSIELDEDWL